MKELEQEGLISGWWDGEVQRGYTEGDGDESVLPEARGMGDSLGP